MGTGLCGQILLAVWLRIHMYFLPCSYRGSRQSKHRQQEITARGAWKLWPVGPRNMGRLIRKDGVSPGLGAESPGIMGHVTWKYGPRHLELWATSPGIMDHVTWN